MPKILGATVTKLSLTGRQDLCTPVIHIYNNIYNIQYLIYIILYYIILYHITSYCIVLYYIVSYYVILYYIILYYIILYYIILYYIILYIIYQYGHLAQPLFNFSYTAYTLYAVYAEYDHIPFNMPYRKGSDHKQKKTKQKRIYTLRQTRISGPLAHTFLLFFT